jgi:hypothetical protein
VFETHPGPGPLMCGIVYQPGAIRSRC